MLDLKEERKYKRLRKLGQELHIPIPEAFWMLEVFDKDGKLIQKHKQRSHSWTRNAYNVMFCQLAGKDADDATFEAGKLSVKDTSEYIQHGDWPASIVDGLSSHRINTNDGTGAGGYRAIAGADDKGIIVGSGTNAESFEDYFLQTQITEGTGAGQISHTQSEAHSISYAALVLANDLIRYFNNNTGGSRDINEVGLVALIGLDMFTWKIMTSRDKLTSTVTVPDTGQLRVTYTIQLTYPS